MTARAALGRGQRVCLGGIEFDAVSEQEAIDRVLGALTRGQGGWICPVNLDVLRRLAQSPQLRELVAAADLVVADGAPLLWANRVAGGARLPERVAGSTLVPALSAACAQAGRSVFMLGGSPGVAERAAIRLQSEHPDLRIAGTLCPQPGFERDPAQIAEIERRLAAAAPDLVFVALGFPKQDRLALSLRTVLPATWFLSCGISLSFVAGDVVRAPRWLQVAGLEWMHRLLQEPRRLARRYLVEDPPYLLRLLGGAVLEGAVRRLAAAGRRVPGASRLWLLAHRTRWRIIFAVRALRSALLTDQPVTFILRDLLPGRWFGEYMVCGGRLRLEHGAGDPWIFQEIFLDGTYVVPDSVAPRRIADLGGNIGMFVLYARTRWPDAEIICFEPDPENLEKCRWTWKHNPGPGCLVERCAMSVEGPVPFSVGLEGGSHVAAGGTATVLLPGVDVFDYLEDVELVKIDIEGSEWAILGDPRFASIAARTVLMEYHPHLCPADDAGAEARRLLQSAGFRVEMINHNVASGVGMLRAFR